MSDFSLDRLKRLQRVVKAKNAELAAPPPPPVQDSFLVSPPTAPRLPVVSQQPLPGLATPFVGGEPLLPLPSSQPPLMPRESGIVNKGEIDVSRTVKSAPPLLPAAQDYIISRSKTPEGQVSAEGEEEASRKAKAILETPFTPGGEARPLTSLVAGNEPGFIGALKPQVFTTPEEEVARQSMRKKAADEALSSLKREYDRDIAVAVGEAQNDLKRRRALLDRNPEYDTNFVAVRDKILERETAKASATLKGKMDVVQTLDAGGTPSYKDLSSYDKVLAVAKDAGISTIEDIFTKKDSKGAIVESAPAYVGRLLSAPVSALVGVAEGIITDKGIGEAVESRIREGAGVTGAGISIADAAIENAGISPDSSVATASRIAGGAGGLIVDLLLPIAPGVGILTKGATQGRSALAAQKALGLVPPQPAGVKGVVGSGKETIDAVARGVAGEVVRTLERGVRAGARTLEEGAKTLARRPVLNISAKVRAMDVFPEYGADAYSRTLARFSSDSDNLTTMQDILAVSDKLTPDDFKAWNSENFDRLKALESAWQKSGKNPADFGAFLERAKTIGAIEDLDFHLGLRASTGDILKRATLADNISADAKKAIAQEALKISGEEIRSVIAALGDIKDVTGDSSDLLKRIEGFVDQLKSKKSEALPNLANPEEVLKQYLIQIGSNTLSKTPSTLPGFTRLTKTSFVPTTEVEGVIKDFNKSPFSSLRDKLVESSDGKVELDKEAIEYIVATIGPTVFRGLPISKPTIPRIVPEITFGDEGKLVINTEAWNNLAEKVLNAIASKVPGFKTLSEAAKEVESLPVASMSRQEYLNKVLTPKEVAGGVFENGLKVAVKKVEEAIKPTPDNPLSSQFLDEIGQKWGAIPEDFKTTYRQARGEGLSAPEAWSKTIINNYIREAGPTADLEASYSQMADDYISMLYGGFESFTEAYNTTGKTMFLDNIPVRPSEMRKITYLLSRQEPIESLRNNFIALASEGKWSEALIKLRDIHAILQGTSIKTLIPDESTLSRLFESSKKSLIIGSTPFKTSSYVADARGILEIWDRASSSTPMFLVDKHLDLLSAQYMVRRQSGIVTETVSDWNKVMPELFPTKAGLDKAAEETFKALDSIYSGADDIIEIDATNILYEYKSEIHTAALIDSLTSFNTSVNNNEALRKTIESIYENKKNKPALKEKVKAAKAAEIEKAKAAKADAKEIAKKAKDDAKEIAEAVKAVETERDKAVKAIEKERDKVVKAANKAVDKANETAKAVEKAEAEVVEAAEAVKQAQNEAAKKTAKAIEKAKVKAVEKAKAKAIEAIEAAKKAQAEADKVVKKAQAEVDEAVKKADQDIETIKKETIKPSDEDLEAIPVDDLFDAEDSSLNDLNILEKLINDSNKFDIYISNISAMSGGDDYIRTIYNTIKSESTPGFINTVRSAILSAASDNIDLITRGAIEAATKVPAIIGDVGAVRASLLARGGIKDFTDAMDSLMISGDARSISLPLDLSKDIKALVEDGLAKTLTLKEADKSSNKLTRYSTYLQKVFGTPTEWFGDGALARTAKSGVLGGFLIPNIKYFMTNYLTAPAIIYSTTGKVVGPTVVFDPKVGLVMKALFGNPEGIKYSAVPSKGLLDLNRETGAAIKPTVVVISPTGKVYTNYDIARLISEGSVTRSQASAELTRNVVDDIASYSAVRSADLTKPMDNLTTAGREGLIESLKRAYGRGSMNIYQEIGNLSDTMFRTKVLIKSLEEGVSEVDALRLARESLFDYSNLTSIERATVSKLFWFWTFRRNSFRTVIKSFLTNPTRMKNAYVANGFLAEVDRDYNIETKDYVQSRPFIYLVNDKANLQRFAVYGPPIPQLDATSQLIDYMSLIMPVFNPGLSGGEAAKEIVSGSASKLLEMGSPLPQTLLGLYFGADIRREGEAFGYYLDPRLIAYLQLNPEMWQTFSSYINVETVPSDEEQPGRGTYNGRQWRIKKGDEASVKAWFAIQQLLLVPGLQRAARDYAPLISYVKEEEDVIPVQMGGERGGLLPVLSALGLVTPISAPTLQDQIEMNKKSLYYKFKEESYK